MKNIFCIIAGIFTIYVSNAQMDDRYYYPSKEWEDTTGMDYSDIWLYNEGEHIMAAILYPDRFVEYIDLLTTN